MKSIALSAIMALIFAFSAFAQDAPPEHIQIDRTDLAPEGLVYDEANGRFLISSLSDGTIHAVADDGTTTPFIEDENLISSAGLEIDPERNRVIVANADLPALEETGIRGTAGVGIYDLDTGDLIEYHDLGALAPQYSHFANDAALDGEGNIYVTDSLAPVIYKITPDGEASVFLEDRGLLISGFGGNGIIYHAHGFLVVGVSGAALFKVPLDAPEDWARVRITSAPWIMSADGMLILSHNGNIMAMQNGVLYELDSDDEWVTARVVVQQEHHGSALTMRGDAMYLLYGHTSEIVKVEGMTAPGD